MSGNVNIGLPSDKLSFRPLEPVEPPETQTMDKTYIVLVSTGSFNPPTYMHLRMFELARDALKLEGFDVIGGYMSPVNDAYKKRGLISAKHRIELCHRACRSSEFIMVDPWEANQNTFQRTLTVLCRIKSSLVESGQISGDSLKVMLVCGSDLLESFSIPGAWIREQASSCSTTDQFKKQRLLRAKVMTICRDFGVVCIRREGQDVDKIICNDDILSEYKNNIKVVNEIVPNQISSTRIRDCILSGLSVKYLTSDEVIDYIKQHHLYSNSMVL
ncbi:nicotinamide/nicotinic acid mononucleotide adenylyltransferase-like isoform X2 [Rhododendron vialii]|uniref:nicotinamide/nicotinic acid mononucleotide adenylyltransferase-like isoform X2 n=1 Tax=Rhododendron vialii TaxID=182163 RepID=UPI00265F9BCD|nr:nicotinamide/nicotinic acid mononucleotide adenylyltransferase-like isoform X2 [Rhododendron vialii]